MRHKADASYTIYGVTHAKPGRTTYFTMAPVKPAASSRSVHVLFFLRLKVIRDYHHAEKQWFQEGPFYVDVKYLL